MRHYFGFRPLQSSTIDEIAAFYVFWGIITFCGEAWCILRKFLRFLFDTVSQMQIFVK